MKMLERLWRKKNLPKILVGMEVGAATVEHSTQVPQKTKNRITIWSSNPTPEHITRQNSNSKRYVHPYVHSSTITIIQTQKQPKCPQKRQMDKEDVVRICNGILLSHHKDQNNVICNIMYVTWDYYSKWS